MANVSAGLIKISWFDPGGDSSDAVMYNSMQRNAPQGPFLLAEERVCTGGTPLCSQTQLLHRPVHLITATQHDTTQS